MDGFANIEGLSAPATGPLGTGNKKSDELGQEDFMALMVAQLTNQDPTKPMDNFQFLGQIAQFGTVDGIREMNVELQAGLNDLASTLRSHQALQAADLVGRGVVTDSNIGILSEEGDLNVQVDLPGSASGITLYVQDMSGQLVLAQPVGAASAGVLNIVWDGSDSQGERMPPGQYRVSAEAVVDGQLRAVNVYAQRTVESVTVDPDDLSVQLNLTGGSKVDVSDVKSFY